MVSNGLCNSSIRLGGFGPMFNGNHSTTCFNDVVLLPLPTFILLLLGLPYLFMSYHKSTTILYQPFNKLIPKIITIIYRLLVLALLLMDILEVVRLGLSNSGVGLLPVSIIGIVIVIFLLFLRKRGQFSGQELGSVLVGYWGLHSWMLRAIANVSLNVVVVYCLLLFSPLVWIFQSVKVSTLIYVENLDKSNSYLGPSMYPDSDKSLDNYVILGLYVVLFLYEVYYLVFPRTLGSASNTALNNTEGGESLVAGPGKEIA